MTTDDTESIEMRTVPQYIYDSLLRSYEAERAMRTDSARLITICMTLEEILAELRRANSIQRTGAVSSVEVEDAAKGPPRLTSKSYIGSPLTTEDVDEQLAIHAYAHRESERLWQANWQATVDALAAEA